MTAAAKAASDPSALERALARDRLNVIIALCVLTAIAWLYLALGAGTGMPAAAMSGWWLAYGIASPPAPWTLSTALVMLSMWQIMMIAMMLPSAAPIILLYARVARRGGHAQTGRGVATFTGGYLLAWLGFSFAATLAQFLLERSGLISTMMATSGTILAGGLLIATGLYQLSPLKAACLASCQAPAPFLAAHWREGPLRMGLRHGAICVGCCWGLMLLLFVGGAMNLVWIAGLTLLVALEKLTRFGKPLSTAVGVLLIASGAMVLWASA